MTATTFGARTRGAGLFHRLVILTGAGVSQESGLATFRDKDGIWSKVRVEDVATPEAFRRDPKRVHAFYNARRQQLLDPAVAPNPAHLALARLDREWQGDLLLVTQNIDDLHERAGSRRLLHLHGELLKARCLSCDAVAPWRQDLDLASLCPSCGRKGQMRVDVVWFGEMPHGLTEVGSALSACDLFVAIGTSGSVYPAAHFVADAARAGAGTLEINLEPSESASHFDSRRHGPASRLVPEFVEELLSQRLSI